MTGAALRKIRRDSRMTAVAFGLALGIDGSTITIARKVRRLEGMAVVPFDIETRAALIMLSNPLGTVLQLKR